MSLVGTLLALWQIGGLQPRAVDELRASRVAGELHAAVAAQAVRAQVLALAHEPAIAEALAGPHREGERRVQELQQELLAAGGSRETELARHSQAAQAAFRTAIA